MTGTLHHLGLLTLRASTTAWVACTIQRLDLSSRWLVQRMTVNCFVHIGGLATTVSIDEQRAEATLFTSSVKPLLLILPRLSTCVQFPEQTFSSHIHRRRQPVLDAECKK